MIFLPHESPEFDVYKIPRGYKSQENSSEIVSENLVCTEINFRCAQKFSVIEVFQQLNMYVLYVFNYLLSFLYSLLSSVQSEEEVSLQ